MQKVEVKSLKTDQLHQTKNIFSFSPSEFKSRPCIQQKRKMKKELKKRELEITIGLILANSFWH